MALRRVVPGDAPALQRIYAHEVAHGSASYEYVAPDVAGMSRRVEAILDAGYPFLVAERGGRVVGYAYASAYRTREGYRWTVEDSVYVEPGHQGRGLGRRLLEALVERCTALGYRQMVAFIGDASNTASIALHERLGFRVVGRFPGLGRKHGRWLENVQMLRALGDGDGSAPAAPPLSDVD